ncbi:MAG: 2-oxoglutarate dehydrogenase complex dihydrolipoyllysine-residue succinyltransferase [Bacteroidia bacterium]|nr:2-oxoglutarate dehydrogenase complex dihydrolipoyllysine-residue succinyltransferase [Bacteroidia bacterium]
MLIDLKVPSPGESVTEVEIANWLRQDGDIVQKDEELCEIDSDKATLTINAEEGGKLIIKVQAGQKVNVGEVVASIDTAFAGATPAANKAAAPAPAPAPEKAEAASAPVAPVKEEKPHPAKGHPSPAAAKAISEKNIPTASVPGTGPGGRITMQDVSTYMQAGFGNKPVSISRAQRKEKMTSLRRKLSQRLVSVKNETAMLTTFNEVDMSAAMNLRKTYKDKFKEVHGVGLGFMSLFTKAVTIALQQFPAVNAQIDGDEIMYFDYADVAIAVSTTKGLMVPVVRNAESLSLADIERNIAALAAKAREGRISLDEMTGGTFTITNGGVFGSMMSTPIINPPQSAILGMHNIVERPVAVQGQVVIRPMMYVALSYDHRIIDGRESVGFLVMVKELLENPERMLFGGKKSGEILLGL